MESDLKDIRTKVFKLHTNTTESLAVINEKLDSINDDLRAFTIVSDKLKTEIQNLHIDNASKSSTIKKADEAFGKVLVLEGRLDKIQSATRTVLSELKIRKSKEGM